MTRRNSTARILDKHGPTEAEFLRSRSKKTKAQTPHTRFVVDFFRFAGQKNPQKIDQVELELKADLYDNIYKASK